MIKGSRGRQSQRYRWTPEATQPIGRVLVATIHADGEVDGRCPVGITADSDHRPRPDPHSSPNRCPLQVRVRRAQSATVVNGHREPTGHRTRERNHARPGRVHRSTNRRRDVDTPMPLVAPNRRKWRNDLARQWHNETRTDRHRPSGQCAHERERDGERWHLVSPRPPLLEQRIPAW